VWFIYKIRPKREVQVSVFSATALKPVSNND